MPPEPDGEKVYPRRRFDALEDPGTDILARLLLNRKRSVLIVDSVLRIGDSISLEETTTNRSFILKDFNLTFKFISAYGRRVLC